VPSLLAVLLAHAATGGALIPSLFVALMAGGTAWFLWMSKRDPASVGAIGVYDETSAADVFPEPPR
jgi:hypothetical protein